MTKQRAVVICPGRGSYTRETLGFLNKARPHIKEFLEDIDQRRKAWGEPTISELDALETFKSPVHTKGEHASPLIYACSFADFASIDREKTEIVAITGNSMGWYTTLALGGALDVAGSFQVIQTMGSMMKETIIGGQVIYPIADDQWQKDLEMEKAVLTMVEELNGRDGNEVYLSIRLGGYAVIGGNKSGLAALMKELPPIENYPMLLVNHAAFHTPLLKETSDKAMQLIGPELFFPPEIPLVDGRGFIWKPWSTKTDQLYDYTLGHQVYAPYDFTKAVMVAVKEFAPDQIILLGPGNSLGGSVAQILIEMDWHGLKNKEQFMKRQSENPLLISMARPEQRPIVATW